MNTIVKTLIAVAFAVETLTVSAQISSLPIGSTNAVLQDALRQINSLDWSVELISKDGMYVEQFFAKQIVRGYNYERDGEPTPFLKQKLAHAINAINWNKPEYEGRMFQSTYDGVKDLWNTWYLLFGEINEFVLERNERGELVPPPVAYKIDLVAALMRGSGHWFFVNNIERATLEVEDGAGKVIDRQDSRDYQPYVNYPIKVVTDDGVLGLSIKYVTSGQPGRVFVWYKSGVQQVFSLADGRLLPSLSIHKAVKGIELLVSSAEPFLIEASENLREWSTLYLSPVIEPASLSFLHRFTDPADAGRRFYRLRIESALQQNRR